MKKSLFTLLIAMATISAMAQTQNDSSFVIRNGETYIVKGMELNKRTFMGYLQSCDAISYSSFRSAYNIANAGWGLLAGGLAIDIAGIVLSYNVISIWSSTTATDLRDDFFTAVAVSISGGLVTAASLICIPIGYMRMHDAVNYYNSNQRSRQYVNQQQGFNLALCASRDGIGLAIQF